MVRAEILSRLKEMEGEEVRYVDGGIAGTLVIERSQLAHLSDSERLLHAHVWIDDGETRHRLPGCSRSITLDKFPEYYDINDNGEITGL